MAMIVSEATAIASFGMKILLSHNMYTNLSEENSRKMRLCVLRAWDLKTIDYLCYLKWVDGL